MPSKFASAVYKYVPAIDSLRTYSFGYFRRDLVAGLTVAAVAVPQAMAYAHIFGMPLEMGLYTAIIMTAVGALLDSSKQLINGPTNVISIAMFSALSVVDEADRVMAAILMAFLVGLIQTAIALLRFGDLSRFISHSVIVGFTLGASVLLLLEQLKNVLGLVEPKEMEHKHFITRFWKTMTEGGAIHWSTVGVGVLTVTCALGFRWINKRYRWGIPELLSSIAIAASLVAFLDPNMASGIRLQPGVPRALPSFELPTFHWEMASNLSSSAAAIAFLGLLEAIAMSKSIATKTGQKLDMNQQCLSEGLANMAGSFFRCFPGSGSLTRSYINHESGAATQWSGIISAVGVAATILVFAPYAQYIPKASLAAVLILTATRMNDFKTLHYYFNATKFDRLVLVATALSAIFINIEFCILIGVFLSFAFFARAAKIKVNELTLTSDRVIREVTPDDMRCSFLRVINVEGEMFFGCGPELERQMEQVVDESPESLRVIILRLKRANNPDAVCMDVLERFIAKMHRRKVIVMLSGIRSDMAKTLSNVGIDQLVGINNVFPEESEIWVSTFTAMKKGYALLGDSRCEHCPNLAIAREQRGDWSYMI
ncbi:MAG: SulP family inorganic anion transporter [Pirellula sp.]